MKVLGIHGGITIRQHEPGACIVVDGHVIAMCEEERYLREKSAYGRLPEYSIRAALKIANLRIEDIDMVVSSGETYSDYEAHLREFFKHNFGHCPKLKLVHHQLAHVASSFYSSGFDSAACISLDASGDGSAGVIAEASRTTGIKIKEYIPATNSLGYFYTIMTYYLGFTDGDEYKVMGLAPYGKANIDLTSVIQPTASGWKLNTDNLRNSPKPLSPFEHQYSPRLESILGQPHRVPGSEVTQFHKDIAASAQKMTTDCMLSIVKTAKKLTEQKNLCLSGGVSLNCSATKHVLYSNTFEQVYIPPSPSDRGLPLGCAYLGAVACGDTPQKLPSPYLGSEYSNDTIHNELKANGCNYTHVSDPAATAAQLISDGSVIGWFQGRSEMGARALGHRSILADPSNKDMKAIVNSRIKFREEFRPFAPAATLEAAPDFFSTNNHEIPFMNFAVDAKPGISERLPATVHVDGTSRLQTVSKANSHFYGLLSALKKKTDLPVVLNTSFNLKGQPIVESPRDALMTFYGCGLDALVMGSYLVTKKK